MQRLARHLKSDVALQAEGFASEPGVLQKVGKRFIRVSGQFFVPHSLQEIVLLGVTRKPRGVPISLHTTYMGSFSAVLVKAGTDYVEVRVSRADEEEELLLLIPLRFIIGIEAAD